MKVMITSQGTTLEDPVDPRFGRCRFFLLVDTETGEIKEISNEAMMQSGGAGIQAAQMVSQQGAEAIITGQVGPNAARVLDSTGIPVYVGASGSVREALEAFKSGKLEKAGGPTVTQHYGMGMGRGMGWGRGMSSASPGGPDPGQGNIGSPETQGDIAELKRIQEDLQKRMSAIQKRIEELENK